MAKTRSLRALSRLSPTEAEIDLLLSELDTHNHRAAAILGGAFVEDALEYAILRRFIALGQERRDSLFDYPGPLSSFGAKIQIGYAVGLYGQIVRHDLDIIRHVRNGFAHAKKPISFDTEEVIKEVERTQYLKWKEKNQQSAVMNSIINTTPVTDSKYRYWYSVLTKLLANELFVLGRRSEIRFSTLADLP